MKNFTLLTLLFISLFGFSQSQTESYKNASSKNGSNYFEIVSKQRIEFENLKSSKKLTLNETKAIKHFERWAYFWKDRVNPDGSFPSSLEGWKNAGLLNGKQPSNPNNFSAKSAEAWVNIGPQANPSPNGYPNPPQLGRLNAFWRYVDAGNANNNVLIVGSPTGGIWKSNDNGATWSPKFDSFAGIGITDIKGSSNSTGNAGVLYATTGDYDAQDKLNSIGVFKSTDMGDTWTATGLNYTLNNGKLLGHLVVYDDNTAIVASANDIMRTTDGGTNWTSVFSPGGQDVNFGRMASNGTNVVATDAFEGIYFSTDSGVNWTELQAPNNSVKHSVTVDDSGDFYVQGEDGQVKKLNLTGNGSLSNYGALIPDPNAEQKGYDAQGGYNQTLLKKGDLLISGSVNGQVTSNGGNTWYNALNGYNTSASEPGVYIHSDHHQMGYLDAGLSFWSANDGGLDFITFTNSTDQKPTIQYKSNGVVVTQIYTISINPSAAASDDFMMANQDNDGFSKEAGTWVSAAAGDGVCSAIDYTNPGIRYLGGTKGSLSRSDNTGFTGNHNGNALPKPADAEFVWPFSLHTTTSTIAFGGFDDMYKSTNISTTTSENASEVWTKLNAGVGNPVTFDNQGDYIAVEGTTGIARSVNGGNSWTAMTQPTGQLANSFSIDAASASGNTIYASVKAYNDGNKVFKSTDGGSTWTNISGDLPNILIKKILFKQNQSSEILFAGTELGVYFSINGGTNWSKLGNNLPNVIVNDMKINYLNDKLYVGTFGRGMWEINIANSTLGTNEASFDVKPVIYPNPVSGNVLNIRLSKMEANSNYVIYNVVGGVISRGTFNKIENNVNLNSFSKGMYIIKINEGNKVFNHKFIIK
ncbi:MAG: T9SS type A sorting domain-containing protein [Polaribacter sp.]|uniref:T9SS type A sorting domain-containing protein n=1 Tax=Polaribacter sp. TaxID=1920175 RepID=UPI003BAF0172